jgi:serine/threonine protein phosphatase PrpC
MHGLASLCHEAGNAGNNGRRCPKHARTVFLPDLNSKSKKSNKEVDPDVQTIELQPGDRLLLCTDVLWGMVSHECLAGILAERNAPETTCRDLVTSGKQAGGQDNLTAVVVDT